MILGMGWQGPGGASLLWQEVLSPDVSFSGTPSLMEGSGKNAAKGGAAPRGILRGLQRVCVHVRDWGPVLCVCVCVCVSGNICVYVCVCQGSGTCAVRVCVHVSGNLCVYACVYQGTYVYVCVIGDLCVCVSDWGPLCVHVSGNLCVYACLCQGPGSSALPRMKGNLNLTNTL